MPSVTIEIGGRSIEIAPYMLGELELAADFIDEMNDRMAAERELERENLEKAPEDRKQPRFKDMIALLRCLVEILAIGTAKADPLLTADAIMTQVDLSFMRSLQTAVMALLAQSGFDRAGEAKAPSPPATAIGAEASPPALEESSTS